MSSTRDWLLLQANPFPQDFVEERAVQLKAMPDLAGVNVLVGANSSGKSRLMRDLASRKAYALASAATASRIADALDEAERLANESESGVSVKLDIGRGPESILPAGASNLQIRIMPSTFFDLRAGILAALSGATLSHEQLSAIRMVEAYATIVNRGWRSAEGGYTERFDRVQVQSEVHFRGKAGIFTDLAATLALINRRERPRTLIPILRSIHTLWEGSKRLRNDVFTQTFRNAYSKGGPPPFDLFTGFDLYERLLKIQCSPRADREDKRSFERFLSVHLFGGREVELVAQFGEDKNDPLHGHINFSLDGQERAFFEIGDGVSGIILLLYPLFLAREGEWFFVEEPEVHLHPAYQRIFIEALVNDTAKLHSRDCRVFITTHSNHILDVAMEHAERVSVFALSRNDERAQFVIRQVQGKDIRVLDALGVRNGSVYLANCSIWVEGPTDVVYLRSFLDVALALRFPEGNPYKEDLHYAIVEYGGSLLANWAFDDDDDPALLDAAVVANRICIIADLDEGKDDKHRKWRDRAARAHGSLKYVTTSGREIENEMSGDLLARIVATKLKTGALPELGVAFDPQTLVGDSLVAAFQDDQANYETVTRWRAKSGTLSKHAKMSFAAVGSKLLASGTPQERAGLLGERGLALANHVLAFIEANNPRRLGRPPT